MLTGDPGGLAAALTRLEHYQGHLWEDLILTGRKVPHPSVLRTHPKTEDRVQRLKELAGIADAPPIVVREAPMVSMIGLGPGDMRPRYRLLGLWY